MLFAQVYFRTERLPFNSAVASEMAPVIYKDGIVYCSNRKDDIVLVTVDQDGGYLYNLYYVENKGGKSWGMSQPFAEELEDRFNQSSTCFSADWNTMYYTATRGGSGRAGDLDQGDTLTNGIFITTQSNGKWSVPEEFPYNSDVYDVGYPSVASDGTRMYFASNMPGGFGKFDIYCSDRKNGRWTQPVNLGPTINTAESDVFPFIYKGTRLYFSSAGHSGQGGLDIFYSDSTDHWQQPENFVITSYSIHYTKLYESVTSVQCTPGTDLSTLSPGDKVVLIQNTGFLVNDEPPEPPMIAERTLSGSQVANVGRYELLAVKTINDGTDVVTFTDTLGTYSNGERIQIVKILEADFAEVNTTLEAQPWNGQTGGVVALVVFKKLRLHANIDVSGQGFRGGA